MNFSINQIIKNLFLIYTLLCLNNAIMGVSLVQYSSNLVDKVEETESIKRYYYEDINNLKEAIKPETIYYIDSRNFVNQHTINTKGILFTFKNLYSKYVYFVSSYNQYHHIKMTRNPHGVWSYILELKQYELLPPNMKISYKFLDDRYFKIDVTNDLYELDQIGNKISIIYMEDKNLKPTIGISTIKKNDYKKERNVLFRIYAPNATSISIVGSFNSWSQSLDKMYKSNGYFEILKCLPPGKYSYLYKKDDEYITDSENIDKKQHPIWGVVSYFEIKE